MSPLTAQILEQKRQRRQTLAQLPFPEKVRIVEKLRDASQRIAAAAQESGMRKGVQSQTPTSRPSGE